MDQSSYGNLGAGGGGSSSSSKASSFLQLQPLSTTTTAAPMGGAYYGTPLALHQATVAAAGSSSQYEFHHHKNGGGGEISQAEADAIKAKIMAHPQYSALLAAYLDCQKVGAPPDVLERLTAMATKLDARPPGRPHEARDPELDQFMEAYCNMLAKYREELERPIEEAMEFLKRVEAQLDSITGGGHGSARLSLAGTVSVHPYTPLPSPPLRPICYMLVCFIYICISTCIHVGVGLAEACRIGKRCSR
uniref:Uncharacterized protein n=1 Tax=Avena sativa TaxID=4498 RepID=A0ACD5UXI8_AVESA